MKQGIRVFTLYDHVCCFILFLTASAASFNGFYTKYHFFDYGAQAVAPLGLPAMLDGTGLRPFVYRQMLPTAANWIDGSTPESLKTWLYNANVGDSSFPDAMFDSTVARSQTYFFRYLIVYVATFLFALLAVYAMHWTCTALDVHPVAALCTPVAFILLLPYIQCKGGFFYDFPELAFFALAVCAALKLKWWWLIPLVALGTWNKESFLLFVPTLYPFFRQRTSQLNAAIGTGALCLVCTAVYYPIHLRFAHNPGGTVLVGLLHQIQFFLHPRLWLLGDPPFEKTYGLLLLPAYTVVPVALLVWTVLRGWHRLPPMIQWHAKIAAAINIPLYLLFGNPGELRNLSFLYVTLLLLMAVNLTQWIANISEFHNQQTSATQ
jgi:hypothetical protein